MRRYYQRYDSFETNDGAGTFDELTLNLTNYITQNIKGYVEYWDRFDARCPLRKTAASRCSSSRASRRSSAGDRGYPRSLQGCILRCTDVRQFLGMVSIRRRPGSFRSTLRRVPRPTESHGAACRGMGGALGEYGIARASQARSTAKLLAYLLVHTQHSVNVAALEEDRSFFEEKCSRCHSLQRIFLAPLTDESRRHVVARMQARSGTDWLSDEDVGRVLSYLTAATTDFEPPEPLSADASAREIFEVHCTGCHMLERKFTKSVDIQDAGSAWEHVVGRMRGKAPQWMTDTEAQSILEYLQDAI